MNIVTYSTKNPHETFDEKVLFNQKVLTDNTLTNLFSEKKLADIFTYDQYTKNVDTIYNRIY